MVIVLSGRLYTGEEIDDMCGGSPLCDYVHILLLDFFRDKNVGEIHRSLYLLYSRSPLSEPDPYYTGERRYMCGGSPLILFFWFTVVF